MKLEVWVVEFGHDYEGYNAIGVFLSRDDAMRFVCEQIAQRQISQSGRFVDQYEPSKEEGRFNAYGPGDSYVGTRWYVDHVCASPAYIY